jgi:hypothetical protein
MLNGRDKAKLAEAGFRIFYRVPGERCIKEQINGSYRVHSRYKNKAELDRAFADLMENCLNIEI